MDAACGTKEVFVIFMERRRPVTFQASDDSEQENRNLLELVEHSFSDVLSAGEGSSFGTGTCFLQKERTSWTGLRSTLRVVSKTMQLST